jgi:predicted phosphoribosyltransferase
MLAEKGIGRFIDYARFEAQDIAFDGWLLWNVDLAVPRRKAVMEKLLTRGASLSQPTQEVMNSVLPSVDSKADISEQYRYLTAGHNAVVVVHDGIAFGVLIKMAVITHLSKKV